MTNKIKIWVEPVSELDKLREQWRDKVMPNIEKARKEIEKSEDFDTLFDEIRQKESSKPNYCTCLVGRTSIRNIG